MITAGGSNLSAFMECLGAERSGIDLPHPSDLTQRLSQLRAPSQSHSSSSFALRSALHPSCAVIALLHCPLPRRVQRALPPLSSLAEVANFSTNTTSSYLALSPHRIAPPHSTSAHPTCCARRPHKVTATTCRNSATCHAASHQAH